MSTDCQRCGASKRGNAKYCDFCATLVLAQAPSITEDIGVQGEKPGAKTDASEFAKTVRKAPTSRWFLYGGLGMIVVLGAWLASLLVGLVQTSIPMRSTGSSMDITARSALERSSAPVPAASADQGRESMPASQLVIATVNPGAPANAKDRPPGGVSVPQRKAVMPVKPAATPATSNAQVTVPEPQAPASAAKLSSPPLEENPTPAMTPQGPFSPKEACGKRVFIALSFCMQEQCDSEKFKNHPQCIEMRQMQKEIQEQRNRN